MSESLSRSLSVSLSVCVVMGARSNVQGQDETEITDSTTKCKIQLSQRLDLLTGREKNERTKKGLQKARHTDGLTRR